MSEGGESKQDSQNLLKSPMSEGGETKQDSQNLLKSPMSEGGEPKQDSQKDSPPSDIGDFNRCWQSFLGSPPQT
jgi:hypothetical protein